MEWIRTISTTSEFPVAEAMLFQAQCACGVLAGFFTTPFTYPFTVHINDRSMSSSAVFGHVTTATSNKFHTCMQIRRFL